MKITRTMAALLTLVMLSVACSQASAPPPSAAPSPQGHEFKIVASVSVFSNLHAEPAKPWTTGVSCTSYDFDGSDVQVSDSSHTVLGVATFPHEGTWTKDELPTGPNVLPERYYSGDGTCSWTAMVQVSNAPVYIVELDGFEPKTVSSTEMAAEDWTLPLSLG